MRPLASNDGSPRQGGEHINRYLGILALFLMDQVFKNIFWAFDFHALIGMAIIISTLVLLHVRKPIRAAQIMAFFSPSLDWVARKWLVCFYSPAVITVPIALSAIDSNSLAKAGIVVLFGVILTAAFTGNIVLLIRRQSGIESDHPRTYEEKHITFTLANHVLWGGIFITSLLVMLVTPYYETRVRSSFAFLLSGTLLGYILGSSLPETIKRVFHPIIVIAIFANACCYTAGQLTGEGYWTVLARFVTKGKGGAAYGPGDVLFSFLPIIILSFGFKVFEQWEVLVRHKAEILGATTSAAAFSMMSTAIMSRGFHLPPELARGLVPRGATLALALPMADVLDAPAPITAAAVALTGIIGGNILLVMLRVFRYDDPISRGVTAAAVAHGVGTAVVGGREPEALPYCALSYALCGVMASLLIAVPPFRALILSITG